MSFDAPFTGQQKIAVIGSGISGLSTAYLMADTSSVQVFEAEDRLGGHARTVLAGKNADQPVDTGFIVFNYVNYPHLTRMFQDLDVPVERSNMSFGASIDDGRLEYGLASLDALFAQRRNAASPSFLRMVRDLFRFNKEAEDRARGSDKTIVELVEEMQLGDWFRDYYLLPMCGAIWSTPATQAMEFPAETMIRFFKNHALMSTHGQHQWWTVKGGSIEYITRLQSNLLDRGVGIHTKCPVRSVERTAIGATLHFWDRPSQDFDQVVFACHPDQALTLLANPTAKEQASLGGIKFQDNTMVLHSDEHMMPKNRACWSSWVYHANTGREDSKVGVTYWMNKLQNIPESDPLFVSLNPVRGIDDSRIFDQKTFRHPVFDHEALAAQKTLATIQGENNTWFVGAYLRNGFHEDGFASAHRVARKMQKVFA